MPIDRTLSDLSGPEARLISMLRLWPLGSAARDAIRDELHGVMGPVRARACLDGLARFEAHLGMAAWVAPRRAAPGTEALTEDEDALCRIVMAATEGRRDEALLQASFVVRPAALLPLVHAAERTGLPLLCAECRARLALSQRAVH